MRRFRPSLVAGALALALCSGTASAQFSSTVHFRRQPERRRPVRRALHDQSRASPRPMYVGSNFGAHVDAVVHRRQRLRAGRRARELAVAADPAGRAEPLDRAAGHRSSSRKGPLDSERALPDPGRRQRHLRAGRGSSLGGQITQAQLQAQVGQAALDLAAQVGRLQAAGAQYIIVQNVPDIGKTPSPRRVGAQAQLHRAVRACSIRR